MAVLNLPHPIPSITLPSTAAVTDELPGHLHHTSDGAPGFSLDRGSGDFTLRDPDGQPVESSSTAKRVRDMVIPPQWTDVWVCADPSGHVQCTGRDARGRKQYIYHPDYVAFRQRSKFAKLILFAEKLPGLRVEVDRQLRRRTWDRERMLALTIRLLDRAHLRIGSARYEAENDTYGLTTLRRRHLEDVDGTRGDGGVLRLCFSGKSGKFRRVTIKNRRLRRLVREVADLPGYRLFHYRDEQGRPADLDSGDVNEYLHRHMGERFSAKDFRTWGGTSYAVRFYPQALAAQTAAGARGRLATKLVRLVAAELGNTVTVCREYYIHPDVLAAAEARALPAEPWPDEASGTALAAYERAALEIISA